MRSGTEQVRLLDEFGMPCSESLKQSESKSWYRQWQCVLVLLILSVSMGLNIVNIMVASRSGTVVRNEQTLFAHLEWNVEAIFSYDNKTGSDESWDAINYDHGSVAFDYEYAESMGLPRAQQFPWDDSKGLYFLNAYHSLHCLKIIREATIQLYHRRTLTHEIEHVMHCFESLLQDVKCFADDTPRYTIEDHPGQPGYGQKRMCRDWNQLVAFSEAHHSCWRDVHPTDSSFDSLKRYRYCPEGSPYSPYVHAVFGDFDREGDSAAETD